LDFPTDVLIHSELLGMKGGRGTLLQVSRHGYYEVNVKFGERLHRVLLPVSGTVLIHQNPEEAVATGEGLEIER
jgi:hypothetical protein